MVRHDMSDDTTAISAWQLRRWEGARSKLQGLGRLTVEICNDSRADGGEFPGGCLQPYEYSALCQPKYDLLHGAESQLRENYQYQRNAEGDTARRSLHVLRLQHEPSTYWHYPPWVMPTLIQQPNSYSKGIKDEHEQKAVSCRV